MDRFSAAATVAALISVISYLPYMAGQLRGTVRPHAFSWLIWTVLTAVGFAGQLQGHAGVGALLFGVTASLAAIITLVAFWKGDRCFTRGDWMMLAGASIALLIWPTLDAPLASVSVAAAIDVAGFIPTWAKMRRDPHSETLGLYWWSAVKHTLGVAGLRALNPLTVIYPLALVAANVAFAGGVLALRRRRH